jgi:Phage integrase family.
MGSEEPTYEYLSDQAVAMLTHAQQVEYALYRAGFIDWMRECGKEPDKGIGLSESSVENYARRHHQLMQWLWELTDYVTATPKQHHADALIIALDDNTITQQNGSNYSGSSKRKFSNVLEKWFAYRQYAYGADPWEPAVELTDDPPEQSADYFVRGERARLWDAAKTYNTPPTYDSLSPEERDRWKAYIAQLLGKSKEDVMPADFRKLRTSWKYPSLVGATLDGALRPIGINRLRVQWLHLDAGRIIIPPEHTAKSTEGDGKHKIALRDRTILALSRWLAQRENKTKYDDSDRVWLTRKGNPYTSKTLNYLLDNLLEEAGIEQDGRKLVWYSFRKSTGQYVEEESDDLTTAAILRTTQENVKNYSDPTHETKRDILERIDE